MGQKEPSEIADRNRQLKGIAVTVAGVVILSPDGLLISVIGLDDWTLIFWRGLLLSIALMILTVVVNGRDWPRAVRAIGREGIGVGLLYGASTIFFVLSVRLTTIANTLFLLSALPLFGALFSRLFLGERITRRTYLTTGIVIIGMGVIFGGDLGAGNFWGNIFGLAVAASGGGLFVLLRKRRMPDPAPAFALGGLLAAIVGFVLAPGELAVPRGDLAPLLILGLFVLPVSFALAGRGPRYLPAPEVNLIMLLEAVLGPLWGVAVIGQIPPSTTLIGGVIVLTTLAGHFAIGLAGERKKT
ncbi:MAG: DMT family transporter [Alphaproteobacteria bacterium]|nr:DMT family transporter [Alphaproteobacteria bacterium]